MARRTPAASTDPATASAPDPIAHLRERTPPLDQAFLRSAAKVDPHRVEEYGRAESYYDGNQKTKLTDRAAQFLENSGLEFNENFCETVVDALAERLRITGVTCDSDPLADFIWGTLWNRNRLDAHQGRITTEILKKGDGYLVVDFDAAKGYPTVVYNAPERCQVAYEDGVKVWAAKTWDTSAKGPLNPAGRAVVRMNVYWPDRIEKFYRLSSDEAGSWAIWVDEGDASWPIDWTHGDSKPIGIPVFHLANKPRADKFGRAEHRGTIPQQDALNKKLIDLASIEDTLGFPQRYIAGDDATTQLSTVPGAIWRSADKGTTFGQFEAAALEGTLASIEAQLLRLAARARMPGHMIVLSGDAPSGESQQTAESGLVAKAEDRALILGEEWIAVLRMMAVLASLHGEAEYAPGLSPEEIEQANLNVSWDDPRTRNEKEHMEMLLLWKEAGVSQKTILSKIPGIDAEQELKNAEAEIGDVGAQLVAALDNGGVPLRPGQGRPVRPPRPVAGAATATAEAFGKPSIGNL